MIGPKRVRRVVLLIAAVAVTAALELFRLAPANAASWLEQNFWLSGPRYDAQLPPCDSGWVLSTIRSRFGTKEGRFWNSDLSILEIGEIRQVAFRPWAEATIPRRFCSGKVLISDGRWRPVHYSIIEDAGMIGMKWGVEWCVVGIDRNWAYNPRCKMAQP
jgi:hypothetical protein